VRAVVFGASGMIGGGVVRECLEDRRVESVLTAGRRTTGLAAAKLDEVVEPDLFSLSAGFRARLRDVDACFYCLGVSSAASGGGSVPNDQRLAFINSSFCIHLPPFVGIVLGGRGVMAVNEAHTP